jgi:hypothetical protein
VHQKIKKKRSESGRKVRKMKVMTKNKPLIRLKNKVLKSNLTLTPRLNKEREINFGSKGKDELNIEKHKLRQSTRDRIKIKNLVKET